MKRVPLIFITLLALAAINGAYLWAFDSATIFYHANVVAHLAFGILLIVGLIWGGGRVLLGARETVRAAGWPAILLYSAAAIVMSVSGLWLAKIGLLRSSWNWQTAHVISSFVFVALFAFIAMRRMPGTRFAKVALAVLAAVIVIPAGSALYQRMFPEAVAVITNPPLAPMSPDDEGPGKDSPYFPSSNKSKTGELIPSDFFLESKACGNSGCHPDITAQWDSSMHHFSSFNNQWYRKSIENMQDVVGTKSSKWCGGCHDMAVLMTGRFDTPIVQQVNTPQAQSGIACLVCHSIVHVDDTMGQGGFTLEYPEMHKLVASKNPLLEFMHDRMLLLDPGPHRKTMLKPFHVQGTPEFCSSCHKVHLDVPVNGYRWFRGFNDYDAWQGSGVSGQGARAFYYPPDGYKKCETCHMPMVASTDKGNINGQVHSHRFPAANTAVPTANKDETQFEVVKKFLTDGILTMDIFAVAEVDEKSRERALAGEDGSSPRPDDAAPVASGLSDEGGSGSAGGSGAVLTGDLIAPIDRASVGARPGSTVRVDVVARTRKIGHFFPGGTADAFDVWMELKAEDANGKVIFWNGWVADEGKGPVDPGAQFYKPQLVDEHGNRINKRNAWQARAVAWAKLIPPGAADTVHFLMKIPADAVGPITLTAKMNYRKFDWFYTQWAFAGEPDPLQAEYGLGHGYDDRHWVFTKDTSDVSGQIKAIPDLPIIVVAKDTKQLALGAKPAVPASDPKDREHWNDYGIGLLLQRDFTGAAAAFKKVTEVDPKYADGWVNRARVSVDEGNHKEALEYLAKAYEMNPKLAKTNYFMGVSLRTFGKYDEALQHLEVAAAEFPRDKVVLNAIGRILFLQRKYTEAVSYFKRSIAVDPEDVAAHYNLMLSYRGMKDTESAKKHETLYLRFKAEESAQSLTQGFRLMNPEDNRLRMLIHEQVNTWTPENVAAQSGQFIGRPGVWDRMTGPPPNLMKAMAPAEPRPAKNDAKTARSAPPADKTQDAGEGGPAVGGY